ncbi:GTPase HflX [Bacillus wiedmannii]|uniref:GTPase HflX n=2 Tax=Bacillus cereus group TaxID=86661 RepID=A0A1G6S372_9BACI|nr:GTPase HflX [Bacillus wiedmannii]EOP09079.1 GTP-binding protein HflX [Bacillus cereus BAG2O-3]EOQ13685.1 GTP-binding protein HflX [Bacillus cereus B5-2]EOQ33407.1 GTP-binding protein HflX [Bacillus cereus BAG3O-1]MBJ8115075.1 GTPase HflX [Bacillus cereus]PFW86367.1 GTPase HflX [Bacillus sp. AFS075960]RFB14029.1 GTPase HflX [Bacillus sp. OE]RFB27149.1 GTPase HflX [Bacillus sp. LB(2018)]RFB48042.1 GTPase HflX [Bacillus sp. dmp10]RFB70139.1 GTPase HflX [Bacillus sp. AW]HDR8172827.1 GTPase
MEELLQRAVLVGVNLGKEDDFAYSMEELTNLAEACDVEVIGQVTQNLQRVNPSHYIGKGKIEEVAAYVNEVDANMVIFNDELSPSQIRNLEADLDCKVIDRTILILDIFAQRAKTKEAQLQVEVAHLQYMMPRLIGLRESLGRQSGGVGTKNKGVGEKKLELDRRKIEEQISVLNKDLEALVAQRQTQRKQRKKNEVPVVALVGYTNAGKSTTMNAMLEIYNGTEEKQVFEKDMLFATLETSVRNIDLPDNKSFLLTDTVGFVSKLPHHLVKAFRSTLEEVAEADLLIHVVDYANPNYEQLIDITNETLKKIGVENIPTIYAYNKSDMVDVEIPKVQEDRVYLSAKKHVGIEELVEMIRSHIYKEYTKCEMLIPYDQGQVVSYFNNHAHVLSTSYENEGTKLEVECKTSDYEKYKRFAI